jgi:hypothetical protein
VASIGSIAGLASIGSIGSVASAGSILSVASRGAFGCVLNRPVLLPLLEKLAVLADRRTTKNLAWRRR